MGSKGSMGVHVSLVPRLHCPAFFALWKNAGQWSLGTRLGASSSEEVGKEACDAYAG